MKLAFILFKYFPFGGLQKDFMHVLKKAHQAGHEIKTYALTWEGEKPPFANVEVIDTPKRAKNHTRYKKFIASVHKKIEEDNFDLIVGFNKMPGLDVYFAADPCFHKKAFERRPWWYRYTSRFKFFYEAEQAIFAPDAKTEILALAPSMKEDFITYYQTPESRFKILPPGIDAANIRPDNAEAVRIQKRQALGIQPHEKLLLCVGSGFATKGLDRTIQAVAQLPMVVRQNLRILVVGEDSAWKYHKLCKKENVSSFFTFLGGRDDVPELMIAADLLCHPARAEAGGKVLLEALLAGLPIITTDVCGYLPYVQDNPGASILRTPFTLAHYVAALQSQLKAEYRPDEISATMKANEQIFMQADVVLSHLEAFEASHASH